MAEYVINLSGNCCELFIALFFLKDNYKPRVKKAVFIPLCIVFTLFQFVNTSLFLGESSLLILGCLIFTFLVTLLYDLKWTYRFLFSIFILLLNAASELLVAMVLAYLFDIDISFMQQTTILFAICTLTSKFLTYIFVLFTKKRWIKADAQSVKQNILLALLLPISSLIILVVLLRCCYQINENGFHIMVLIACVILVFANIAIFYIIDKQNELIETKEKLLFTEKHINNQIIHYQDLYKYQNEMRIFRHDIRNRLLAITGILKESDIDKALHAMQSNLDMLNEMNKNIVDTGNPITDAILQSKLSDADSKGIKLSISTKLTDKIIIDEMELGIVLGNALDNAIEAVEKISDGENKTIQFKLISAKERISISIKNPVKENVDVNNLSTTKLNKIFHGYGVERIKQIARKYDGFANFTCEDKCFAVNINISNCKK